jgi:argininosuccinate lyase
LIDLPDDLVGISSAMPQKRNLPILERIRGKTAHVSAAYVDILLGQRSTPYTNLVEVSKEAGAGLLPMISTTRSILRLLATVFEHLQFREDRMRTACEGEYLGGFALANLLTLRGGIPYRTAQVIAGRFIANMIRREDDLRESGAALLRHICSDHGYEITLSDEVVVDTFDVDRNLHEKRTAGSTSPKAVQEVLCSQEEERMAVWERWNDRRAQVENAFRDVAALLSPDREDAIA